MWQKEYEPQGGQLIHQLSEGAIFSWNLCLGCTIACWKDLFEKDNSWQGYKILWQIPNSHNAKEKFQGLKKELKVQDLKSYRKDAKIENCFESVKEMGGHQYPPRSQNKQKPLKAKFKVNVPINQLELQFPTKFLLDLKNNLNRKMVQFLH